MQIDKKNLQFVVLKNRLVFVDDVEEVVDRRNSFDHLFVIILHEGKQMRHRRALRHEVVGSNRSAKFFFQELQSFAQNSTIAWMRVHQKLVKVNRHRAVVDALHRALKVDVKLERLHQLVADLVMIHPGKLQIEIPELHQLVFTGMIQELLD